MSTETEKSQLLEDDPDGTREWRALRGNVRHQTVGMIGEIFAILRILLQDAIILVVGFAVEFAFEHWLHSEQPFFKLAINISSAMFLLLYGVMVSVHVVHYVREQFGVTAANVTGNWIPWSLAAAGVIAAVIAFSRPGAQDSAQTSTGPTQVSRFAITLPPGDRLLTNSNSQALDVSQDGSQIVYAAIHAGVQQLFVREINKMEVQPIRGTEEARSPFFSPDGQSVGFFATPQIRKIAVSGGTPQNVTNTVNDIGGASWGPNNTIVYANGAVEAISAIPASGGAASPLTSLKGENSHRWPQLLPGGKVLLFTNYISSGDTSQILVERTDTHERKVLVQGGSFPRYVPTGHLLFVRAATLMAVPLDLDRLEVKGQAVSVVEGVMQSGNGAGQFGVSNSGTLAYVPGGIQGIDRTLVWVDRKGAETPIAAPLRAYDQPKLSPDDRHLAIRIDSSIWIYDLVRGALTRLTFEGGNLRPIWTPDGRRVAYGSSKVGKPIFGGNPPTAAAAKSSSPTANSSFCRVPFRRNW